MAYISQGNLQDYLQITITSSTWATQVIVYAQKVVESYCGTTWTDATVPADVQLATLELAGNIVRQGEAHWEQKQRDRVDNAPKFYATVYHFLDSNVKDLLRPYVTTASKAANVMKHIQMSRPDYEDDFDTTASEVIEGEMRNL
jgi:hypothetical protein